MRAKIFYYSLTGNTRRVSQVLAEVLNKNNIDVEIQQVIALDESSSFFKQGLRAFFKRKAKIAPIDMDISNFEIICIGSPVWALTVPAGMRTFLDQLQSLKDKDVIIFVTYGSGVGKDKCIREITTICTSREAKSVRSISFKDKDTLDKNKIYESLSKLVKQLL